MPNLTAILLLIQVAVFVLIAIGTRKKPDPRIFGVASIGLLAIGMIMTATYVQNAIDFTLLFTYAVWIINLSRLLETRQSPVYVKATAFRDTKYFMLICLSLLFLAETQIDASKLFENYTQMTAVVGLLVLISTIVSLNKYKYAPNTSAQPFKKLPAVTLAIPARNETHALKQTLEAALTNNYEKIEILVLDDCSQDETAQIIRSFAHDGVRFVQGDEPAEGWIGKNQAYDTLLAQASGDYIIFCGVDVHLSVDSISQMIDYVLRNKLKMLSVMPMRQSTDFRAHVLQPVRHFWQFALPRFLTSTPAVISSCWVADRKALVKAGGFAAVHNSLTPEAHLAKKFAQTGSYQYLLSGYDMGLSTRKLPSSQADTALRTLYPTLKRSFALSWLALALIKLLFVTPFILTAYFIMQGEFNFVYIAAGTLTAAHVLILANIAPPSLLTSLITFPLSMIATMILIIMSAWQYEFGEISWKGRNVCIPVTGFVSGGGEPQGLESKS